MSAIKDESDRLGLRGREIDVRLWRNGDKYSAYSFVRKFAPPSSKEVRDWYECRSLEIPANALLLFHYLAVRIGNVVVEDTQHCVCHLRKDGLFNFCHF